MKKIDLPIYYFRTTAKREYSDWRSAIVREFFQNSVDAGASNFRMNLSENDLYTVLSVKDDGHGMTVQDCEEKLLTMGGSGKSENAVGGFGVAKGILFFAWDKWEIRSQDYVVMGEGCQYEITKTDQYVNGVHATVHIDKKENFSDSYIRNYLARCDTYINIFINDEPFRNRRHAGKRLRHLEWATLHKAKTQDKQKVSSPYMAVRVKGMHMFNVYVEDRLDCRLTLELFGDTRDKMTSNRDGLKSPFSEQLQALVRDISINIMSSLEEKDEIVFQKFRGTGLENIRTERKPVTEEMIEKALRHVENIFDGTELTSGQSVPDDKIVENPVMNDIGTEADEDSTLDDFPDVLVKTVSRKLPAKFNPKSWPYKVKTIMKLWLMVLRQTLIDNKLECRFGIGITLDPERFAEFAKYEDIPYFLLNLESWYSSKKSKTGKSLLPKVSGKTGLMLIRELRQRAAHEVGHAVEGKDHNESFVARVHEIESNTWANENLYNSLPKLVSRKKSKKAIDVIE